MRTVMIIRTAAIGAVAFAAAIAMTACGPQARKAASHPDSLVQPAAFAATPPAAAPPAAAPPAATAPAAVPGAGTPASTPPAAVPTPPPAVRVAGMYVKVVGESVDKIYVLTPGAKAWAYVADQSTPKIYYGSGYFLSPSGTMMAGIVGGKLITTAPDGTGERVLQNPPKGGSVCFPRWSADSARLMFGVLAKDGKHTTLYTMNADGTGRRVVPGATTEAACVAAWSADSSTIAFNRTYMAGLDIREYHEIIVASGTQHHEVAVQVTDKVHIDSVVALSTDGRTAVVSAMTVRPDGSCGDGDDHWFVVDLGTGRSTEITAPGGSTFSGEMLFDGSGHVVATVMSPRHGMMFERFDVKGHSVGMLPKLPVSKSAYLELLYSLA